METQQPVSTNSGKNTNRIWLGVGGVLFLCCCGVAVMAGAAGVYFYTSTPIATINNATPQLQWLVTADELNSFSEEIGIVQWELVEATPGDYRVCNTFSGISWSVNPNQATNCVFQTVSNSLDDNISDMFESGQLFSDEVPINASFDFEGEYALYAGTFPTTAHAVYDLLLLQDGLLYWSSVTIGSPVGVSPVELFEYSPQVIQDFLERMIRINLDRSRS